MTDSFYLNVGYYADIKGVNHKRLIKSEAIDILRRRIEGLGYTWEYFTQKKRTRELTDIRKVAANFLYKNRFTNHEIGKHLNLDHSTIVYHRRTFNELIEFDHDIQSLNQQFNSL